MNKKLILVACMALVLAGCGDKDDSASSNAESNMTDKTMDITTDSMKPAGEMNHESTGMASEPAAAAPAQESTGSATPGTAGEAASGAMENAGKMTNDAVEKANDAAGDAIKDAAPAQ
jgi:hypothetical protein